MKDQLMSDLKEAMKAKDTVRKATITMLRSQIKQFEVDNRADVTEEMIIDIIAKQVKQKNAAIEEFEKAERSDLVDEAKREIEVLMAYLPKQLTEEEIRALVAQTVSEVGATSQKDMGKVMGALAPKTKGKADNKLVSQVVRELLNQ
ncbi:GatB/YqeY domain-containing protein [Fusibacter sp. JL216-2]|uniref:GatB/YqeY domain-containing protein n=1 Tax=Fusibacter sp. JL216-2 TaxID=3071453 RepID=UPI003D350E0F